MTKERTLKESYQIVLDNFDSINTSGICILFQILRENGKITYKEQCLLSENFRSNKPWIFSKFYWNKYFTDCRFWWETNEKGNEQRRKFLQYLIDKL